MSNPPPELTVYQCRAAFVAGVNLTNMIRDLQQTMCMPHAPQHPHANYILTALKEWQAVAHRNCGRYLQIDGPHAERA